jgi:undecaprenyl diphosphate synthase
MKTLPNHVAIIMDGNGRWAEQRGLPRLFGHRAGARTVRRAVEAAQRAGVRYLTLYTFSVANWQRPQEEVDGLLELIGETVRTDADDLLKNGVRVRVAGELDDLPARVRQPVDWLVDMSKHNRDLHLTLALSYGGRHDLCHAARQLAARVAAGQLLPEEIDETMVRRALTTAELPDPDLIIRTGGERRLSDFLVFEAAYAELFFSDVLWPDFTAADLELTLSDYAGRERRFGKTSEQVQHAARSPSSASLSDAA